jgi:hypothetical protein
MDIILQTWLLAAAYATPVLFGLGVYLAFARKPRRVEAAAISWGIGWAAVNLVTFTANQLFGARLDGTFYAVTAGTLTAGGLGLVAYRRDRLRSLLRWPFLPPELKSGFGFAALVLLSGFLLLVLYKAMIVWPAAADALIYHMELPKAAFQGATLPFHAGVDLIDLASTYPDLLVTQQLWIYLGTTTFDSVFVRPIMPAYAILLFVLMFFDVRRWFGLATALTSVAALASLQGFAATTMVMFDEVPLAFYGYLALRLAVDASQQHGSWVPAGLFAGAAGLVKYQGFAAFAALGLALLVDAWWARHRHANHTTSDRWDVSLKRLAGFSVAGLAVTAVFLARNTISLGNPFYPYFFGGVDTEATAYYSEIYTPQVITEIWGFEAVALLSTVVIGCLLLGLFRVRTWTRIERLLFLMSVFYLPPYLYYPLPSQHIRYLAPILPAIAAFAGRQLVWWSREARIPQRIAGAALFAGLAGLVVALAARWQFQSPYIAEYAMGSARVFLILAALITALVLVAALVSGRARTAVTLGISLVLFTPGVFAVAAEQWEPRQNVWQVDLLPHSEDAYLSERLGSDWSMWKWINENLPANSTLLSFEPRLFYIDVRVLFAASHELTPTLNMTLDEAVAFLHTLGVQYVLNSLLASGPLVNQIFWRRSVLYQNLGNQSVFRPFHVEGDTVLYQLA